MAGDTGDVYFLYPPTLFLFIYIHITPGQYRIDIEGFIALRRPEYTSYRLLLGLPLSGGIA